MKVLLSIIETLIVLVPILMAVAFVTIAERKIMASMQRRCGPNAVGVWGLLQPYIASGWEIRLCAGKLLNIINQQKSKKLIEKF